MPLEAPNVADPPDMIASAVRVRIRPSHLPAGQVLAFVDCLEHRAVAVTPPADVVHLAGARSLKEMPKRVHQVEGVDVVANLLAGVPEHDIRGVINRTLYQISKKTMQLRP